MASVAGFDIAKAGWLYRRSSVLHRWKKNWFTLDCQGDLRYFESPDTPKAEDRIVVRAVVTQIKCGPECKKAEPPEGVSHSKVCFLELVMRDKESMLLCAESFDDMRAWQIALEEARTLPVPVHPPTMSTTTTTTYVCPPGYYMYGSPYMTSGYSGQIISPPPTQVMHTSGVTSIINAPPGQQIVYVDDGPYRYRRRYAPTIYPVPLFFW